MVRLNSLAAFGLLTFAGQAMAQASVKVMPFGASIVTRCWRNNLYNKLLAAGVTNFDFVGSQVGSPTCVSQFPGSDNDHEGHSGSQATDYVAQGNLTTWLNAQPQVDVIVMFVGHNDILIGHKPQDQIMKAYDTLISQMRTKNPKMQIVWSNLTPVDPKRWDSKDFPNNSKDVASLSAKIKDVAPTKSTSDSPVRFVNNFDGYDPVADTEDGLHPATSGNEKLATKFLSAVKDAIQNAGKPTVKKMKNQNIGNDFLNTIKAFLDDEKDL